MVCDYYEIDFITPRKTALFPGSVTKNETRSLQHFEKKIWSTKLLKVLAAFVATTFIRRFGKQLLVKYSHAKENLPISVQTLALHVSLVRSLLLFAGGFLDLTAHFSYIACDSTDKERGPLGSRRPFLGCRFHRRAESFELAVLILL